MEPIPPTSHAIDELDELVYDTDLREQLRSTAAQVQALVPTCVAMSVTMLDHDVTLTLVATDTPTAVLDATQYLDGGPCIAAVEAGHVVPSDADLLNEHNWHLFARASAAHGIESTLSMPLLGAGGAVIGGVNLYATTPHGFEAHHDALASICGAWATGAVENADLSFHSRTRAHQAPAILQDRTRIEAATGLLAHRLALPIDTARERLHTAAISVGLSVGALARALLGLSDQQPADHLAPGPAEPHE